MRRAGNRARARVITAFAALGLLVPAAGVMTAVGGGTSAAASAAHVDATTSWTVYHGNALGSGVRHARA